MNAFIQACHKMVPLTPMAEAALTEKLEAVTFDKGDYLVRPDKVCHHFYFLESGLVKVFFSGPDKDFIMRFFPEGTFTSVLESFISQKSSKYGMQALEASKVHQLHFEHFAELCDAHVCIEKFQKKIYELATLNMMRRISEMLEENPAERYRNFVLHNGTLLNRISLGDLASYLGITQVSLSRIRARK